MLINWAAMAVISQEISATNGPTGISTNIFIRDWAKRRNTEITVFEAIR